MDSSTHRAHSRAAAEPDNTITPAGLFEAAFRASGVAMTISGLDDGRLIEINDACLEMIGLSRSEVIGKTIEEAGILVDPSQNRTQSLVGEPGGSVLDQEMAFRGPNGEIGWGQVSSTIVQIESKRCVLSIVSDSTRRHVAEEALRASEARFSAAFNSAGVMMVLSRLSDGRVVDVNRTFLEQSGYSRDEVMGKTAYDIQVFADPTDGERIAQAIAEQGQIRDMEVVIASRDGGLRHALLSVDLVDLDGEPHLITAAVDTTRRLEEAEALRSSEDRYRTLVEQVADGVLLLDDQARVLDVNPALAAYLGRSVDELIGSVWTDYVEPENLTDVPFQRPEFPAGQTSVFERRLKRPDGTVAELEIHARRLGNGRMLGVARDIGARKAADRERARLIQAIEQSDDMIGITDPAGIVVYVNPALERYSGVARDQAIGQHFTQLQKGPRDAGADAEALAVVQREGRWSGELPSRRPDGSLGWGLVGISSVLDESGKIVNYVIEQRDITREHELEDQLRQAQKMEAVGRLAGGVAHDFNNLLTAISGFTELAMLEASPGSELAEYLTEIRGSTERATSLVRQLLAFGRRAVVKPEVINLNSVIGDVSAMLARIIGEDVTLDLELDPELCGTLADRGQLEQVIVNLAVNARDAMPPGGGSMTIRTENVSHDGAHAAEHPEFKAGDYVRLSIADTGVGMEPGTLEHIFEPFFTTRGAAGGTGLGLATVYGIVRASGGDIAVTSELGHGSCFMIYLPAVDAVAQAAPLPEQARPVVPGRETILVVEDEKAVLDLAVKLLRRQGYTVLRASSGKEAVELARSHPGRIDLLFSDLVMPGLSGQETGKAIRAIRPGIRELFSSGYSEDMNASRGLEPGFRFVAKPYTSETLSRSVRDALNSPE